MVAVAVVLVGGGCAAAGDTSEEVQEGEPLRIGVMVPLSGGAASYGNSVQRGVELAVEDSGANVELIFEDSKCAGPDAAAAASRLINVNRVDAIIGELCSDATTAAAPVTSGASVPLISPASTAPGISDLGEFVFRTISSDLKQGSFGAKLVSERGFSKLGILHTNEQYGVGFDAVLKERAPEEGIEIIASEAIAADALDARAQIAKIKAAGPDSLYIISNAPQTSAAILKQVKEVGLGGVQLFGSEGLKSEDVVLGAGPGGAEGLVLTTVSSGNEEFVMAHTEKFGEAPGPFAAQAYDAMMALINANEAEGTLVEALRGVSFEGVGGPIAFDENGDVMEASYEVFTVKAGAFVQE